MSQSVIKFTTDLGREYIATFSSADRCIVFTDCHSGEKAKAPLELVRAAALFFEGGVLRIADQLVKEMVWKELGEQH